MENKSTTPSKSEFDGKKRRNVFGGNVTREPGKGKKKQVTVDETHYKNLSRSIAYYKRLIRFYEDMMAFIVKNSCYRFERLENEKILLASMICILNEQHNKIIHDLQTKNNETLRTVSENHNKILNDVILKLITEKNNLLSGLTEINREFRVEINDLVNENVVLRENVMRLKSELFKFQIERNYQANNIGQKTSIINMPESKSKKPSIKIDENYKLFQTKTSELKKFKEKPYSEKHKPEAELNSRSKAENESPEKPFYDLNSKHHKHNLNRHSVPGISESVSREIEYTRESSCSTQGRKDNHPRLYDKESDEYIVF